MKKTLLFISACAVVLFTAACNKEQEKAGTQDNNLEIEPEYITASMDSETKATLAESDGAFAFSSGDAIKVCNESGAFSGTTTSTENSGTFAMADGFNGSTNGIAGFPTSLVTAMTTSSVTFTLPSSYEYSEVGSSDPDAGKVPCPMIGSYDASTKKVSLKQAGAVIRFRITNIAAGSLSFSFPTRVTGTIELTSVPSGDNDGILASALTSYGNTINVTSVPTVTSGYIYITLPVPTGTSPQDILVTNTPSDPSVASRMQSLPGSATALNRARGWRFGVSPSAILTPSFKVSPTKAVVLAPGNLIAEIESYADGKATASKWMFGGYLQTIGKAEGTGNYHLAKGTGVEKGMLVDLFVWQGASVDAEHRAHGLINVGSANATWLGNDPNEDVYDGCWDGLTIEDAGAYTWFNLTNSEWDYIINCRTTTTLGTVPNARCARTTVAGVNGLLLFPDNVGLVWDTGTMGDYPKDINRTKTTAGTTIPYNYGSEGENYTSDQMLAMAAVGIAFLPCTGYRSGTTLAADDSMLKWGYYWTNSGQPTNVNYAMYLNFAPNGFNVGGYNRWVGRAVRLAREVVVPISSASTGAELRDGWDVLD